MACRSCDSRGGVVLCVLDTAVSGEPARWYGQRRRSRRAAVPGDRIGSTDVFPSERMGEIDLLGMVIAAVVLVHLLLGGAGQHRRQVQREDLGVEILADRQG